MLDTAVGKWRNAIDTISVNWNTYDYLDGNKPMNISSINGDVKSAISVKDTRVTASHPFGGGMSHPIYIHTYGSAVVTFINDWSGRIGVATGKRPDNVKTEVPNAFGCFTAGTKVIISNRQCMSIEEVTEGMKILSHGGTISTQTNEQVATLVPMEETIYGFNNEDPFFSRGHAFWTTEGWKAIDPQLAREENPDLAIGTLQVGDIVFCIAQSSPLLYKPVIIHDFTSRKMEAATTMYGLHLTGYMSYHANGYVVVMNYPQLTQKRLRDGISKLNLEEKAHLASAVSTVIPELSKSLGGFIPPVLANAGILHLDKSKESDVISQQKES